MSLITNNALGWAHLQISGGWRRVAWICGVIAVLLPLIIFGSLQLNDTAATNSRGRSSAASVLTGWYTTLGVVQGGLLLIGVPSRVHGAIKRDRLSKLHESHRLMPTPAAHAIVGYIVGPNLLIGCCMATVFAIGVAIAVPAHQDIRGWVGLHAAALGLSAMLCCLVAFTTQWIPKFNPALLGLFLGPAAGMLSITLLPPLRALFLPYFGSGFNDLQRGEINALHVVAFGSQLLLGSILFIGACRRFRRDDVPALGFGWGFVLLSVWVALALVGIRLIQPDQLMFREDQTEGIAFIVTVSLSMLLAVGPLAAAAMVGRTWRERKRSDPHFIDPRPVPLPAAALLLTALLCALLIAAPQNIGDLVGGGWNRHALRSSDALVVTGVQMLIFVVTIAMLAWASARMRLSTSAMLTGPWIGLTWAAPPVIDAIAAAVGNDLEEFPRAMSAGSPPFCLSQAWSGHLDRAVIGLAAQAGLMLVLWLLWSLLKRANARPQRQLAGR